MVGPMGDGWGDVVFCEMCEMCGEALWGHEVIHAVIRLWSAAEEAEQAEAESAAEAEVADVVEEAEEAEGVEEVEAAAVEADGAEVAISVFGPKNKPKT